MSGVWFLVRQSTPVMLPASPGGCSGAEPSALSGSGEILRSSASARPPGAGVACAAASVVWSAESDIPASAAAEIWIVSRRDIVVGFIWAPSSGPAIADGCRPWTPSYLFDCPAASMATAGYGNNGEEDCSRSQNFGRLPFLVFMDFAADPVGDRQHQHGDGEDEQNTDHPAELDVVDAPVDVHEPFQHVDGRNRNDRAEQLLLEPGEPDPDEATRPTRVIGSGDMGHEVLIT